MALFSKWLLSYRGFASTSRRGNMLARVWICPLTKSSGSSMCFVLMYYSTSMNFTFVSQNSFSCTSQHAWHVGTFFWTNYNLFETGHIFRRLILIVIWQHLCTSAFLYVDLLKRSYNDVCISIESASFNTFEFHCLHLESIFLPDH